MAAASVTLATTTLAEGVNDRAAQIKVTSITGIVPGTTCLYIDRELIAVVSVGLVNALGTYLNVKRGVGGFQTAHQGAAPALIGRADQFYESDPVGPPPAEALVSPWINLLTGDRFVPQGDSAGSRWWAKNVNTHGIGALGVRTNTYAPSKVTQA